MVAKAASILIVEDHSVIGSAMAMALRANGLGTVTVTAPEDLTVAGVTALAEGCQASVVLLDLYLGLGQVSLPMIAPLRASGATVVLFTSSGDARLLASALREGVAGILDKATSFDEVLQALADVAAGRPLLTSAAREGLIASLEQEFSQDDQHLQRLQALTPREADVLSLLVEGLAPKQIARREVISLSTVRGHIERIYRKLEVGSQREALALARQVGWPSGQYG